MAMVSEDATDNTYEEARKQRLEENRKRFQDLGISDLSRSLSKVSNSPTATSKHRQPKPRSKPGDEFQPRRSSRPRNHITSYVDDFQADLDLSAKRRRSNGSRLNSSWTSYVVRPLEEVILASFEERERARIAAERFEETLPSDHPVFVKSMVRSHVYSCFWLGLPSQFCASHLPKRDSDIILEDETGSIYDTKYLSGRAGLSGGWRAFALERKLNDGDAVVFELVEPERFKVYIFRTTSDSGRKPNADAVVCKESDGDQQSHKRQRVKEDNDDNAADEEGAAEPTPRRLTGRKTAAKNQMKKNGLDETARRKSGRRSTVAASDEMNEKGSTVEEGRTEEHALVPEEQKGKPKPVTDEKAVEEEEAVCAKEVKPAAIKTRKKAAPRLFRKKVY